MKILFTIDRFGSGGKERRLTELMKMLKLNEDIQFELIIMDQNIHYKEVLDLGIKIHYISRKIKKDPLVFIQFYRICKSFRPDIVHCWDGMTAVYMIPPCKLLGIKLLNGMITNAPENMNMFHKNWNYSKLTFLFSDVIVGNSLAGLLAYNAPKKKSSCIYNGFNFDRLNNLTDANVMRNLHHISSKYVIGMVATFSLKKDYRTYYDAAQILLDKGHDITFIAIGRDTDSAQSISLIKNGNLEHFRLLGERTGIESFINMMDICVLCTYTEAISNSILEYMALEKPVIATDGGGTNEIVVDQKTGYLLHQSDPAELVEKIELLLNDKELRDRMGALGKKTICKKFSIEKMVNGYTAMYNANFHK